MSSHKSLLTLMLLSWLCSTCFLPPMSSECREFFSRPLDEHGKHIATYELEKQLRIFRCGLTRHPPEITLAAYIADSRKDQVPTVIERLEREPDELLQYGIVEVLERMAIKGYLQDRTAVANRVRRVIAKMKNPAFRERSEKALGTIEQTSSY